MRSIILASLLVLISLSVSAQQYFIKGTVTAKESGEPLSFANIRVAGTSTGSAANKSGEYELRLASGTYSLIASYIGYRSDTITISVDRDISGTNFQLPEIRLNLQEVVVFPGENPALEIIRRAIRKKNERNANLTSYDFEAFTKGTIKTDQEIKAGRSSVSLGVGSDSSELFISGILENHSKGYFKKPGRYKEIILARKQSANFPPSINTLTGGRLIQNFYDNEVSFFGRQMPGPLADNALSYYFFYLERSIARDNDTVYQIFITPENNSDPGFQGVIFISSSGYDLIKVDLNLNRAANTGGIFDTINVFQQFDLYDEIFMPVDYRIFVKANVAGLVKFGFELNSVMYNYNINSQIDDSFFDLAVLSVLSDADKRDSVYWLSTQTIPNTDEEQKAYLRIDSLSNLPFNFWDEFSILSTRLNFSPDFSVSAPLGMYHFNRVEGHAVDFGMFLNDAYDKRFNTSLKTAYGFSDKKVKADFNASYLFGEYRTYSVSLNAFNRINTLFGESEDYNELTSTLLSLISKYEFRDYYFSKGINIKFSGEVFPVLRLSAGFFNRTDRSAVNNSNFSIFNKDKVYRVNPLVTETKINAVTFGFRFDFRNYIEDGFFRRRTGWNRSYIIFEGDITRSAKSLLKSEMDFTAYSLGISGRLNTFNTASLGFKVEAGYTDGNIPFQMLTALPGNINLTARTYTFRTLNINEVLGDRVVAFYLDHNFGDELFRLLKVPVLKDSEIQLNTFVNAAYTDVKNTSLNSLNYSFKTLNNIFYEAGFGLGHVLFPIRFEFAWKLNHRNGNNFRFGMNAFIF